MENEMSFECSFSAKGLDYKLWIEDDGRVCYAYLLDPDGNISSQVWLYNRGSNPQTFEDAPGEPPRNPKVFVADTTYTLPKSTDDLSAQWAHAGGVLYGRVLIRREIVAILAPGIDPGWSVLAKTDGPVAKALRRSPPSDFEDVIQQIRALNTPE